jgi:hypothetical protein
MWSKIMEIKEIIAISGTILASLGGGVVIVFAFSNWLGKVWANRLMEKERAEHNEELERLKSKFLKETESYKIKLKKSELLFEKQFEAASEFVALFRSFMPAYSFPHMEWEDVCNHFVRISENIERDLDKYLSRHGAVLGGDVVDKISSCIGISGEIKFGAKSPDVSGHSMSEASRLHDELEKTEELLLNKVHSQAST